MNSVFLTTSVFLMTVCFPAWAVAPIISDVVASGITTSGAVITWTTDKVSDSRVNYGTTSSYGKVVRDLTMVTAHRIELRNLAANTLYYFRVRSKDSAGDLRTSPGFTLRTLAATPVPDPSPLPPLPASSAILPGAKWYWQLQGAIDTSKQVSVYDIDVFDTPASTIASLKASGRKVICYFSAGSYENWRPDAAQFPAASLGSAMDGWAGEKWIDVRNPGLRSVMAARIAMAKSKGCDGVEPDNVDGYSNSTGFALTAQDQIAYNSFLADEAHAQGLIIALKNATDLVEALVNKFDFAVVEECFRYNECAAYLPFIRQNKAVLSAEYSSYSDATCSEATRLGFSTVFFNLDLDGRVFRPCP